VKLGNRLVPPWASGLILGVLLGAGALGRPNLFLLLIAALPVWLWARHHKARGWLIPAVALYLLVSSRPPIKMSDGAAYSFLGNYYTKNNNEAKAQEAFAEAYRLDPNKVEAIVSYARILRQRDRQREAADMWRAN